MTSPFHCPIKPLLQTDPSCIVYVTTPPVGRSGARFNTWPWYSKNRRSYVSVPTNRFCMRRRGWMKAKRVTKSKLQQFPTPEAEAWPKIQRTIRHAMGIQRSVQDNQMRGPLGGGHIRSRFHAVSPFEKSGWLEQNFRIVILAGCLPLRFALWLFCCIVNLPRWETLWHWPRLLTCIR